MRYLVLILVTLLIAACSTFYFNAPELKSACKAGVQDYDDGTVNFHCFAKGKPSETH